MNSQIEQHYRTLDLEPGANLEAVRQAYRQLVKVWHPDRFEHDQSLKTAANAKLGKINSAYQTLVAHLEHDEQDNGVRAANNENPKSNSKRPDAAGIYGLGLDRYYARDYKNAFHFFMQSAEQGFARAQYAVGFVLYHHKHYIPWNAYASKSYWDEILMWWNKAAASGNADAQYMIGMFYQYGFCVEYNEVKAKKWFERAAQAGHSLANQALKGTNLVHKLRAVPLVKWVMSPPPGAPLPS